MPFYSFFLDKLNDAQWITKIPAFMKPASSHDSPTLHQVLKQFYPICTLTIYLSKNPNQYILPTLKICPFNSDNPIKVSQPSLLKVTLISHLI